MINKCEVCQSEFVTKLSHVKKGWGRFCSRKCQYQGVKIGKDFACEVCGLGVYKTPRQLTNSKSGKYFCSKSCQTIWRNSQYTGSKHKLWKGGYTGYRKRKIRSGEQMVCLMCQEEDQRVLAVHHVDENRKNNDLKNLVWLCHNCHHLVHCDSLEKGKLSVILGK